MPRQVPNPDRPKYKWRYEEPPWVVYRNADIRLGEKLEKLRQWKDWGQLTMSENTGVSRPAVNLYEKGPRRTIPPLGYVVRVLEATGMPRKEWGWILNSPELQDDIEETAWIAETLDLTDSGPKPKRGSKSSTRWYRALEAAGLPKDKAVLVGRMVDLAEALPTQRAVA